MEGPSVSLLCRSSPTSRVPSRVPPRYTGGAHVPRVTRTHTHTRAWGTRESSRARATGPAVELSRSGLRGVAVLAPDYDLPTVLFLTFFFSFSSLSFDANSEKWRTFEEKGKKRRRGDCLLGFDFSKRCNLDKKR